MLQNAYLLAKIGADTAENDQHFAENLSKTGNYPTGPRSEPSGLPPSRRAGGAAPPAEAIVPRRKRRLERDFSQFFVRPSHLVGLDRQRL